MKKKRKLNILNLPFISILDERPKAEQFILLAWDIRGWCGYESVWWDKEEEHCKHAVAWLPLPETHVYTRRCAIVLKKRPRTTPVILKWSKHYNKISNGNYINIDKAPRLAHVNRSPSIATEDYNI